MTIIEVSAVFARDCFELSLKSFFRPSRSVFTFANPSQKNLRATSIASGMKAEHDMVWTPAKIAWRKSPREASSPALQQRLTSSTFVLVRFIDHE